jgi:hypothetical protein
MQSDHAGGSKKACAWKTCLASAHRGNGPTQWRTASGEAGERRVHRVRRECVVYTLSLPRRPVPAITCYARQVRVSTLESSCHDAGTRSKTCSTAAAWTGGVGRSGACEGMWRVPVNAAYAPLLKAWGPKRRAGSQSTNSSRDSAHTGDTKAGSGTSESLFVPAQRLCKAHTGCISSTQQHTRNAVSGAEKSTDQSIGSGRACICRKGVGRSISGIP